MKYTAKYTERSTPSLDECINPVLIGRIVSPFGIKGFVKILISPDFCDYVAKNIRKIEFFTCANKRFKFILESRKGEVLNVSSSEIASRNEAELLKGHDLYVSGDNLPQLEEDEYLYSSLVGLSVFNELNQEIGKIAAVNNFGAGDLIDIEFPGGKTQLYPFTRDIFLEIRDDRVIASLPSFE